MVALWPHRFGQGAALLTDPLTLLPLSLLDARRRTRPRAGRPASSRRCKGVVLLARAASPGRAMIGQCSLQTDAANWRYGS